MAYANNSPTRFDGLGLKARYHRILETLVERSQKRKMYRQTVNELQALSDRDLADFGFHRSEIPRIAKKSAGLA
ncbi:DUF1127 domain-containing protein [Marivita sp.]|uniref:DUF1127 domain-containing protein n=1 Tax=Marivita sp. TaxID=2003365 RepID=UPI0025BFE58E|nr:DUF1127 domain-containing protein [Marivita sp.]